MSWRDRPYSDEPSFPAGNAGFAFRKPPQIVMYLVIANVAVHFLHVLSLRFFDFPAVFGLSLAGLKDIYFWQPVTYMFVHQANPATGEYIFHLLFNMIMLYFIGSEIERMLGRDRFLQFYGTCGLIGGLAYLGLAVIFPEYRGVPLIGASGAIYGLLAAAMIFFPQMKIILLVFPVPIRVFGMILAGILLLQVLSPTGVDNLGGEICHIGGALTAVAVFHFWGMLPKTNLPGTQWAASSAAKLRKGAWERKQKKLAQEQSEVDRILEKVHQSGLQSLSRSERRLLKQATRRQNERDRDRGRIDRL